jgi:hypothetical protein
MGTTLFVMALTLGAPAQHHAGYFEQKSAQVFNAFVAFSTARPVEERQNALEVARQRDRLMLPGGASTIEGGAMGAALMGAAVFVSAHAPGKLRRAVDGPVHFGPAMFEAGGMGAAVAARF